jgi:hypothetical protein
MMRIKFCMFLAIILVGQTAGFSQDLDQLPGRVSQLWEFRKNMNKVDALPLIDPETRKIYLQWNEPPFSAFTVTGIEFTGTPANVNVVLKVHALLPRIGEIDRIVREPWIWKDGAWFMRAKTTPTLFDTDEDKPAAPVVPEFKITNTTIDLGRHAQGEKLEGKISFTAVRDDIVVIRPIQRVAGLAIGSPVWTSPTEGYMPYQWDTTLISEDIKQSIGLEATATSDGRKSVDLNFQGRIDGKIRFTQTPGVVDTATAGQVELQMQNLTKSPIKIVSLSSNNPSYVIDENIQDTMEPGKSTRLLIRYTAQTEPVSTSLTLVLSESVGPSPFTIVPINIKQPEPKKPTTYQPEDLKKILNTVPKPTQP